MKKRITKIASSVFALMLILANTALQRYTWDFSNSNDYTLSDDTLFSFSGGELGLRATVNNGSFTENDKVGDLIDKTLALGGANNVAISGDYVYVVARDEEALTIVDISNPAAPTQVSTVRDSDDPSYKFEDPVDVYVSGDYAYVTGYGTESLNVFDVSDKQNPTVVASVLNADLVGTPMGNPISIEGSGNYVYVASNSDQGIVVFDVSDPLNPTHVAEITDPANLAGLYDTDLEGNYLYAIGAGGDGLTIFDISNPLIPAIAGSINDVADIGNKFEDPRAIDVEGNYAYVASQVDQAIAIIDVSNPLLPVQTGFYDAGAIVNDVHASGTQVYTYAANLLSIDASNPALPVLDDTLAVNSPSSLNIVGDNLFVSANGLSSLEIVNIADPLNLSLTGSIADDDVPDHKLEIPFDFDIYGNYALVTSYWEDAITVVDISDLDDMQIHSEYVDIINLNNPQYIKITGDYAVVSGLDYFNIYDISDLENIIEVSTIVDDAEYQISEIQTIQIVGDYLYITSIDDHTFSIFDISDKANPTEVSKVSGINPAFTIFGASGLSVSGNYAYIAASDDDAVSVIDISDKANPTQVASIADGDDIGYLLNGASEILVSGDYAYVGAKDETSIVILDVSDPLNPTYLADVAQDENASAKIDEIVSFELSGNLLYANSQPTNGYTGVVVIDVLDPNNPSAIAFYNQLNNDFTQAKLYDDYLLITERQNDEFETISIDAIYDVTEPTVINSVSLEYNSELTGFTVDESANNSGTITYQLSPDNGVNWYFHNGANWAVTLNGSADSNTAAEVNNNIATFDDDAGFGDLLWRAYYDSDGTQATGLDNLEVVINNDPTDISFSDNDITEDNNIGDLIALMTTTDADVDDNHVYDFCGGDDDAFFQIDGDRLEAGAVFDESNPADNNLDNVYDLCIETDDSNGGTYQENFSVTVDQKSTARRSGGGGGGGSSSSSTTSSTDSSTDESTTDSSEESTTDSSEDSSNNEEPTAENTFEDISEHWAEAYILELQAQGVVNGKTANTFAPDDYVTRAELTKMVLLAFNKELVSDFEQFFDDVQEDDWYALHITSAKLLQIVDGYGDGLFRPNQEINRAEALKVVLEATLKAQMEESELQDSPFEDVEADKWFAHYVNFAYQEGIVSGRSETTFEPGSLITRAEVAKIIVMIQNLLAE